MKLKAWVGLFLGIVGTTISAVEGYNLRSVQISITQFGFADYLSFAFWIGFVMLLIGAYLVAGSNNNICYLIMLFMIGIVMYNMPFFAEELPRDSDAYWHMSSANWISQNNFLPFSLFRTYTRLAYLQYPALFIDTAALKSVAALNSLTIMQFYPVFSTAIFVLGFFVLARELIGSKDKAFIATLFGVVANGAMFSNHFSSSATAQSFFPLMVYVVLKGAMSPKMRTRFLAVLFISGFSMILLHAIMPLLLFVLMFSLCIFFYASRKSVKSPMINLRAAFAFGSLLLLLMMMYFLWGWGVANWGFTQFATTLASFFNVVTPYTTTVLQRQVLIFPLVGWIKRSIFLVFTVPALLVLLVQFLKKNIGAVHVMFVSIFAVWFLISLVSWASDRLLVWVVPFAMLVLVGANLNFIHTNHDLRRLLQIGFLVALILVASLTFATFYSDEATYIMTKAQYRGFEYLTNMPPNGSIFGGYKYQLYFFNDTRGDYVTASTLNTATVVFFTSELYAWYYWHQGTNSNTYTSTFNECAVDPSLNLIYSNGDFTIFKRNSS